jgi:hypothetical protein
MQFDRSLLKSQKNILSPSRGSKKKNVIASKKQADCLACFVTVKMEAICFSKILVNLCKSSRFCSLEDNVLHSF